MPVVETVLPSLVLLATIALIVMLARYVVRRAQRRLS